MVAGVRVARGEVVVVVHALARDLGDAVAPMGNAVTGPLHRAFWDAVGAKPSEQERLELDRFLSEAMLRARARWPRLAVDEGGFLSHWASVLTRGDELGAQLRDTRVEDLYLSYACAQDVPLASTFFSELVLPTLAAAVRRIDPSPTFGEEVRQRVLERLLVRSEDRRPRIAEFGGQSSLAHWVRAVGVRLALNLRRDQRRAPELADDDRQLELAAPMRDPHLQVLQKKYGAALSTALRAAFEPLDQRTRAVLRMHYVDGLSLAQIGVSYQVNKSTVSRWLNEARARLLAEVRGALVERHGVAPADVESLIRALDSQVDFSLASALRSHSG